MSAAHADPRGRGLPAAVCSADGRLLWANREGEAILRTCVLALADEPIRFADSRTDGTFRDLLARVRKGDLRACEFVLRPARPLDRADALWCLALPASTPQRPHDRAATALALLLHRCRRRATLDASRIQQRLCLTPAEADVLARLMDGATLPEIAACRDSSVATIRSYLRSMRRKLACHSQVELVATGWKQVALVPELGGGSSTS